MKCLFLDTVITMLRKYNMSSSVLCSTKVLTLPFILFDPFYTKAFLWTNKRNFSNCNIVSRHKQSKTICLKWTSEKLLIGICSSLVAKQRCSPFDFCNTRGFFVSATDKCAWLDIQENRAGAGDEWIERQVCLVPRLIQCLSLATEFLLCESHCKPARSPALVVNDVFVWAVLGDLPPLPAPKRSFYTWDEALRAAPDSGKIVDVTHQLSEAETCLCPAQCQTMLPCQFA